MYLQTSRLQYNLQGVVSFQTAYSKKYIRLSPYGNCTTNTMILQPAFVTKNRQMLKSQYFSAENCCYLACSVV